MDGNARFCLEVRGDYACFTRPEMKVERVSYDVITPSAARAIFDAVLWKPAIRWRVLRIEVLNPIRWTSVRRNEVGAVASPRSAPILVEDQRQQRAGLFLRDVAYRIHARLVLLPSPARQDGALGAGADTRDSLAKYTAIFARRARRGQCFNQPYLGCREFSCAFRLIELVAGRPSPREPAPIAETRDLGFMLYDLDYSNPADPKPAFFRPTMDEGVIEVPPWDSGEVRK